MVVPRRKVLVLMIHLIRQLNEGSSSNLLKLRASGVQFYSLED